MEISDTITGYEGTIETVYLDKGIYKYRITEFGDEFDLIIDIEKNLYIINEIVLNEEEYEEILQIQINSLISKSMEPESLVSIISEYEVVEGINDQYDELHELYEYHIENHLHLGNARCMFCPLNTTAIPTTGYNSKEYDLGSKSKSFTFALTTAVIAGVASYLTFGLTAVASGMISGLLTLVGASVVSGTAEYHLYQSFHKICYSAVKQRKRSWLIDTRTGKNVSRDVYNYFYSSKPY